MTTRKSKSIRLAMFRADNHAYWFAPMIQKCDPFLLREHSNDRNPPSAARLPRDDRADRHLGSGSEGAADPPQSFSQKLKEFLTLPFFTLNLLRRMSTYCSTTRIADELGVSQSAVSYVLNDRWREKRISRETRDRILKYARRIRYRPNRLAQCLQARRSYTVGVIVSFIMGSFYQEILSGIESILGRSFVLLLGVSENNAEKEAKLIEQFLEYRVDGLLVAWSGAAGTHELLGEIVAKQIPLVMIDRYNPRLKTHFVGANNKKLGERITQHLIETGLKEIYFLGSNASLTSSIDRAQGYRAAMKERGLQPRALLLSPLPQAEGAREDIRLGYSGLKQIASEAKPPFGIVTVNTPVAWGVLRAARETGLRIPDQLSIGVIGKESNNDLLETPLTCVTLETETIGREAAQILHNLIEHSNHRKQTVRRLIPGEFVQGKSTPPQSRL
ncbi:MAG: LacI family DNA-binding transcriptional regulator [Verrucomicrobia bacterium]|nr:LacI family DNA-binding transcriptional regulator [Verrucomicrobiota bacterium]